MAASQAAGTADGSTQHTQNHDAERFAALKKLREPFAANLVQALPKVSCRACTDSRTKNCERHAKQRCARCGNFITVAHVDLDYVGHAELTDRLLEVDPLWSWEPLAFDEQGLPRFDGNRGLWIRLTICGHTRIGYGDAQGKVGANAIKEAIGDALRNAAMRFGAALDLWAKSDLHTSQAEAQDAAGVAAPAASEPSKQQALAELVADVRQGWNDPGSVEAALLRAEKAQLSQEQMEGPDGRLYRVDALLGARLAELKSYQPRPDVYAAAGVVTGQQRNQEVA